MAETDKRTAKTTVRLRRDGRSLVLSLPLFTPKGMVRVKRAIPSRESAPVFACSQELASSDYFEWQIGYQNKFGYYYRQEGTTIRRTNAKGEVDELVGGLGLGKRIDVISLYQLLTLAEDSNKHGELTHLAAWEQGDKDGFTRNWIVNLPRHFYPEIGFPEYQMPGTDR